MSRTEMLQLVAPATMLVAAALLAAERRLIRHLIRSAAASPETAVPLSAKAPFTRIRLSRLRSTGAVVPVGADRFYLDAVAYARYRQSRRKRVRVVLAIVLPLILLLWMLACADSGSDLPGVDTSAAGDSLPPLTATGPQWKIRRLEVAPSRFRPAGVARYEARAA